VADAERVAGFENVRWKVEEYDDEAEREAGTEAVRWAVSVSVCANDGE